MKKFVLILTVLSIILVASGCDDGKKNLYLPEAKNDKIYTTVGGNDGKVQNDKSSLHDGEGYTLTVPSKGYRYEKDFDDGNLEETWDYTSRDDIEIKVTTYKKTDAATAQSRFLRENDDYIFEDFMGYPLCGMELDGDTLWFDLHEANGNVYIVSWEYPKNTSEEIKSELASIADSFEIKEVK